MAELALRWGTRTRPARARAGAHHRWRAGLPGDGPVRPLAAAGGCDHARRPVGDPAVRWMAPRGRRLVVSMAAVVLLIAGPQSLWLLAASFAGWLLVRRRPLRAWFTVALPLASGILLANVFREYSGMPLALAIQLAVLVGSAWLGCPDRPGATAPSRTPSLAPVSSAHGLQSRIRQERIHSCRPSGPHGRAAGCYVTAGAPGALQPRIRDHGRDGADELRRRHHEDRHHPRPRRRGRRDRLPVPGRRLRRRDRRLRARAGQHLQAPAVAHPGAGLRRVPGSRRRRDLLVRAGAARARTASSGRRCSAPAWCSASRSCCSRPARCASPSGPPRSSSSRASRTRCSRS